MVESIEMYFKILYIYQYMYVNTITKQILIHI